MLKRFCFKIALSIIVLVIVVSASALSVFAAETQKYVFDNADFLTDAEELALEEQAKNLSERCGAKFIIACKYSNYYEGDWILQENDLSDNDDIIMLIITTSGGEYYYDLYTYGNAYSKITNVEINRVLDNSEVYPNIKGGELYMGLSAYMICAEKAYTSFLWAEFGDLLTVGIFAAVVTFVIATVVIISSYKKKQKSAQYPLDRYTKMDLVHSDDRYVRSSVTRVRVNSSSSGGGGRGGRSGGGGGHRGGR